MQHLSPKMKGLKLPVNLPKKYDFGSHMECALDHAIHSYEDPRFETVAERTVMGFNLPKWQRGLVWTEDQSISLIENIWRGVPIGTYTYNLLIGGGPLDGLLIDGQQRLWAIQQYVEDVFPVFGGFYSDLSKIQKRRFGIGSKFPCYITKSKDEKYLKEYYNLMNFGGVKHDESERA